MDSAVATITRTSSAESLEALFARPLTFIDTILKVLVSAQSGSDVFQRSRVALITELVNM